MSRRAARIAALVGAVAVQPLMHSGCGGGPGMPAPAPGGPGSTVPTITPAGVIHGRSQTMSAPQSLATQFLPVPRPLSDADRARSLVDTDKRSATWRSRWVAAVPASELAGPQPGTESVPAAAPMTPSAQARRTRPQQTSGSLMMETSLLTPWSAGLPVRIVGEPAIALSDRAIWWTGNWYAAMSTDGGRNWSYADPASDFATFTSDQDTVYDAGRNLFLWYRQGRLVPGSQENSVKLSASSNGAQSWCTYTLRPTDVDPSWTNFDFDYPRLALSRNFLYLTSTLLVTGGSFTTPRMLLFRMPLDQLATCDSVSYVYWTATEGWAWAAVENGAAETMYLGDTLDSGGGGSVGKFRLYAQPENSTDLTYTDHDIPAWTFTDFNGLCMVPGGGNPCARGDQRITSGWLRRDRRRGEIGFFWNVREGGGFPHPYVNAVTFDEEAQTVTGRPFLWSPSCAWQYAAASPNDIQELGIAAFYFCDSQNPAHAAGINDAYTPTPPGWTMYYTRVSAITTTTMIWGDYIRVRPTSGHGFAATGYTLQPAGSQPHYTRFARP